MRVDIAAGVRPARRRYPSGGREPRNAVPTRRCVAPCCTAASRSPLMPADTTSPPGGSCAASAATTRQPGEGRVRVAARAAPRPSRPPRRSDAAASIALGQAASAVGPRPRLAAAPVRRVVEVDLDQDVDRAARRRGRPGPAPSTSRGRSTEWTTSAYAATDAALLVCSWPTKCHAQVGEPGAARAGLGRGLLVAGSRRRRAPRGGRWPTSVAGKVLVTTTSVTLVRVAAGRAAGRGDPRLDRGPRPAASSSRRGVMVDLRHGQPGQRRRSGR